MIDPSTKLSPHFALSEFMTPRVPEDYPGAWVSTKLVALVELLEWLRSLAGVPGRVNSAYRSPAHNDDVGGVKDSQHMDGDAADVTFTLVALRVLAERVQQSIVEGSAPAFGQVILYADKGHVHISNTAPRLGSRNGQALFSPGLRSDGTRIYELLGDAIAQRQIPYLSQPQTREGLLSPASSSSRSSSSGSSALQRGGGHNA